MLGLAAAVPLEAALAAAEVTEARALEAALAMLLAADSTAELAAEAAAEVADSTALETAAPAEAAALAAADVADATGVPMGMSRGTPACWQMSLTPAMVAAWSSAWQAPKTQGSTDDNSVAPFLQWQAKSVRAAQPSDDRGPTKQFN